MINNIIMNIINEHTKWCLLCQIYYIYRVSHHSYDDILALARRYTEDQRSRSCLSMLLFPGQSSICLFKASTVSVISLQLPAFWPSPKVN